MPAFALRYDGRAVTRIVCAFDKSGAPIVAGEDGQPFAARHMTTARAHAVRAAAEVGVPVIIGTLDELSTFKPRLVVNPDGTAAPPAGAKSGDERVGDCKASPDGPACFCPNCRAARRRR